jgi:hypothetical protein
MPRGAQRRSKFRWTNGECLIEFGDRIGRRSSIIHTASRRF